MKLVTLVALVATAAAVGAAVALADGETLAQVGASAVAAPWPLLAAVSAYALAFVLRAAAWGPLLPVHVALAVRVRAVLSMLAVNHAVPGPVGEVVRAGLLGRHGVALRPALGSVAGARVADAACLGLLLVAGASLAGAAPPWAPWAAPAALLGVPVAWALARRAGAAPPPRSLAVVAAWALPSWALECGVVWAVARAAGIELDLGAAVLVTAASVLAQVVAVLPGGVGTYEAGATAALVALGVDPAQALAVALAAHAIKFAFAFAAGIPALAVELGGAARAVDGVRGMLAGASDHTPTTAPRHA